MRARAVLPMLPLLGACVTTESVPDYERFYENAPYTVVVLPPRAVSMHSTETGGR